MFRTKNTADGMRHDDFELTLETLKDLTVTGREADAVKGGKTGVGQACYCGTM